MSNYVGMILLIDLAKQKKWEKVGELSNYVGMNFIAKQTTKMWYKVGGGSNYVGMILLIDLAKKSEKT